MKTAHMVLIGAGVLGVGYLFLRPRSASAMSGSYLPGVNVQETAADAAARAVGEIRSAVGAKASTGWASGIKSVANQVAAANNNGAARAAGKYADTLVPGSGTLVESVARKASNAITSKTISAGSAAVAKIKSWF